MSPGTMVTPKQGEYEKEAMGKESPKNVSLAMVQTTHSPLRGSKLLRLMQRSIGPPIQTCAHSGLHVARTVVAPKQGVHEKKATGKESQKM